MLISRTRRLAFVHIQKTGGSTIADLLARHVSDLETLGAKHGFAADVRDRLPDWDGYFKFAFVRNPWDRLVSWYSMIEQARDISWFGTLWNERRRRHYRQARRNPLWRQVMEQGGGFEGFIRHCHEPVVVDQGVRYSFAFNQVDYLSDGAGGRLVDFVGRFENWEADAGTVFDRLGIRVPAWPRRNPSRHAHYTTYYTPELAELVARRYARDIAAFGYAFAGEGT